MSPFKSLHTNSSSRFKIQYKSRGYPRQSPFGRAQITFFAFLFRNKTVIIALLTEKSKITEFTGG